MYHVHSASPAVRDRRIFRRKTGRDVRTAHCETLCAADPPSPRRGTCPATAVIETLIVG
jgi:hypothetical protein